MNEIFEAVRQDDDIDRRGFLKCMAWAGSGVLFGMVGGIPRSFNLSQIALDQNVAKAAGAMMAESSFSFVQISDSHIGFSKDANKDVLGTLQAAVGKINGADAKPDLLIHTGDLSHLSKDEEFDALDQILKDVRVGERFFVPGEHDILVDNGKNYRERYGKKALGDGWYSFDHHGVHFIALVNVMNLKPGGMGQLGEAQLDWLAKDVQSLSSSTPIVVFAHVPLWTVYPEWGWGTDDGTRALELLKRFGSVTVLNGHIHQTMQKVEGNMTFHTACSTAFPQPKPGQAKGPGPMIVPASELRGLLGLTSVHYMEHDSHLAIVDSTLKDTDAASNSVSIENFTFSPTSLGVTAGSGVVWTNRDDIPHTVVHKDGLFRSKVLDTGDTFEFAFRKGGTFEYYCSLHAHMVGKVVVS
ncbi:MAG: metallophosphoesterase [Armatimonadetes bacterium]|nr:metallophosphoesterase [Armatimonadota bacterium]MBS1726172.1 metallophosphoesterase [Armatimonadota bacterium]